MIRQSAENVRDHGQKRRLEALRFPQDKPALPKTEKQMGRDEILPGTLALLILRTLARGGEMHGFEIARSIQQFSQDVLQVEEGSL